MLAKNWGDPVRWDRKHDHSLMLAEPMGMKLAPVTVFPSLCDWLDDEVPIEWLVRFLTLIHDTPNLTWLLLTKRPENWHERLVAARLRLAHMAIADAANAEKHNAVNAWLEWWRSGDAPPANVWVGTSVEDQIRADERIPALLDIPAAGRFLSVEPLLGEVDLWGARYKRENGGQAGAVSSWKPSVDWVIVGGESGPGSRPCNVRWIRSIVRDCQGASVPVFVKQLGAVCVVNPCGQNHFDWRHETSNQDRPDDKLFEEYGDVWRVLLNHKKGGDPAEWPSHLRVREFPTALGGAR